MDTNKFKELMKSRKFWASIVGLLVSVGLISVDAEQELVNAVLVIVTVYVGGTGLEDIGKSAARRTKADRE